MNTDNEFMIKLITLLDKQKSKSQINSDIKELEKVIRKIRLIGTFSKGTTKSELNQTIKQLETQLRQVKLQAKIDNRQLNREINNALRNVNARDIQFNLNSGRLNAQIRRMLSQARELVERNPLNLNIDLKKERLMNQLTTFLNKNTKINESSYWLGEAERLRTVIGSITNPAELRNAIDQFNVFTSGVRATGFAAVSTTDKIKTMLGKIVQVGNYFGLAFVAVNKFRASLNSLKEMDTIFTEISKTTDLAAQKLQELADRSYSIASKYGVLAKNFSTSLQEMSHAGFGDGKALPLAELATLAQSAGALTSDLANDYLIASNAAYGYQGNVEKLNALLDSQNQVTNRNAVSMTELADATKVAANQLANSNISENEMTALLGTGIATTKESGQVVGRAVKAIIMNLQQVVNTDEGLETTAEDLGKVESRLNSLGIKMKEVVDGTTRLRNPILLLEELAEVYNALPQDSAERANIIADIGGKYRGNVLSSILTNWSTYTKMLGDYENAAGSALREAEKTADSWEGRLAQLQNSWDSFVSSITSKDTIKGGISVLDNIIQEFEKLTDTIGAIPVLMTTVNTSMAALNKNYGINQLFNQQTRRLDVQGNFMGIDITAFKAQKKHFHEAEIAMGYWNQQLIEGTTNIDTFGGEIVQNNAQLKAYLATTSVDAPASLAGYKAYLNAAGVSTDALRLKTVLMTSAISLGLSLGIQAAVTAISKLIRMQEEIRQSAESAAKAYSDSSDSISDYISRYQELHKALLKAKGNEEETYNVKRQLLDLQTELNDKYGEEYGAINLVTDAYKDQTEAIKALNKEAAQTYLNENQKGIKQASDKMTSKDHYNLSYTGIVSESDEGKILKEIAEKYKEQGVRLSEETDGAQFSIHLDADPKSAYDTIQAFENDVRDKARELGDEHLFDDVLEISSVSLNNAKSTIDKYGDIYKQALTTDIVSDDNKAKIYNEALEAVQAYNEAVLQSEDIYNDKSVEKTRQSLQALHNEISNNEAWEKYGFLMDDIFDQADTRLLDFNEALKNDSGLQKLTDDLKDLSDLDLKALDENIGDNTSFDKLKESAEKYNISVEELIDSLVRLGVVQGEIASESSELEEPKWDFSTTLENLDKVKESLDVLDKSFAKLFDKDEAIGFEDLSSINEAFKDLEGIDDYIKRIQEAGQNTEEISQIFGELTGAYLEHAGVLSNVTEENKELVIQMLEEMGIANAEEIVLAQLNETAETLALKKQFLAQTGYELVDATLEEIAQFLNEVDASNEAKQALAQLALEKIDLSNINFDESGNIDQLISLANAAGASAMAIAKAKQAINTINSINEKGANGSAGDFKRLDYATKTVSDIKNHSYDWQYEKLNPNDFKINSSPKYTPQYKGGSNTNKAIEQAKKDSEKEAKKAAKEAENQFEKTIDFFERRVQVLSDAFTNLEKGMENVFGADVKNALVTAQIGIVDEEINNYTDALAMYRQKANEALSGVSSDLRDKIKDGAVQLTDFIGDGNEEVVEAMEAYEGWADKVADCTQKLEELKTQIRQLELQKFNNIVEDFTNQFDIHGDAVDLIDKQIGLLEEAGQLIGESFYSKQIEQSEKQLNVLEAEKRRLVEQMNEALTSGRIQKGTDEWLEMVNALSDVEGNILDCKTAVEEFDNELLNLNWQIFERVQTEFGNISSELENLAGLFDDFNEIKVSDGKGTWTKEAIATLGLYAQQYELARHQVGQYGEAIDKLNQDYASGKYSATEYADKLADLVDGQWDAVNSAESLEDAIIDLNKTRVDEEIKVIEDEIDAYKKLTDAQIEALDAAKDLHDYEQSISQKTKAVTDIERQLAAMQNDSSQATIAKRKQLEEQLAEAKKALTEEEYNHSIETQKDALNQQYTAFEEERNKEIEALQLTLEDRETLIANSLETVKANASTVGEQIAMIAQEHGIIVSDAIISSWKSGENAIASYGEVLSAGTSAFIGNIMGVQEYVYGLQAQANSTADSLAWMFSTRADNLVNELTSSYYSEANLNAMTNTLQNSLINTLERGYNINGITSALSSIASGADSVASAANKAA